MQIAWSERLPRSTDDSPQSHDHQRHAAEPDDLTLVRLASTDPEAFGMLYERYEPIVYHFCLRRLSDADLAADVTSTVFTRALAALPRYSAHPGRQGATFRSWLFAIAHNLVVDTYRRRRPHVSLDRPDPLQLVDPAASPEEQAILADDARRFRAVLGSLPERQRAIVELRLAGLTGIEIASALSMSESAVKSAQFRAYGTLRTLLGDDPEGIP